MWGVFHLFSSELASTKYRHKEAEQQVIPSLIVFVSNWLGFHTVNNWEVVPAMD